MSFNENDNIVTSKLELPASESSSSNIQFCWICFSTSVEDTLAEWVHPCKCSGTIRWVHQKCLQRWVEEKQKDNSSRPVQCPHCKTEYMIILPRMGIVVGVLHELNEIIKLFCPFLVGGMAVVILYWTSVTYGAITVLQVMGYNDGIRLLERTHPLALIIGLPSIPVSLILSQFFRWDDMILSCIGKEPYTRRQNIEDSSSFLNSSSNSSTPTSGARIICTALLLPTVSVIIGKVFKSIESNLIKTILGGLSFIAVKGAIKIILQHSEFVRKRHKKILDYTESNLFEFINNQANLSISDASSSGVGSNTSMELLVIENLMQM